MTLGAERIEGLKADLDAAYQAAQRAWGSVSVVRERLGRIKESRSRRLARGWDVTRQDTAIARWGRVIPELEAVALRAQSTYDRLHEEARRSWNADG